MIKDSSVKRLYKKHMCTPRCYTAIIKEVQKTLYLSACADFKTAQERAYALGIARATFDNWEKMYGGVNEV